MIQTSDPTTHLGQVAQKAIKPASSNCLKYILKTKIYKQKGLDYCSKQRFFAKWKTQKQVKSFTLGKHRGKTPSIGS